MIYGPIAFALPPVSNCLIESFNLKQVNFCVTLVIYIYVKQFPDGPYINDFLVFSETDGQIMKNVQACLDF